MGKQDPVQDIINIIRGARAHIKATIKKSGFGVEELGLDPTVLSLIKPTKKRKKKRRGVVQKAVVQKK